jgi:hypothetical protein
MERMLKRNSDSITSQQSAAAIPATFDGYHLLIIEVPRLDGPMTQK